MRARTNQGEWLALMVGNSRFHWAWFVEGTLKVAWDVAQGWPNLEKSLWQNVIEIAPPSVEQELRAMIQEPPELWIASVVPDQSARWQDYPHLVPLTLDHIPLKESYPTLGIDRALALWGALITAGAPALVIDGGTALTLTGADGEGRLVGGAILPGLQLQLRSLSQNTAALPLVNTSEGREKLPERWGSTTPAAIYSGVLYTILAGLKGFIEDWWQRFPDSGIVLTGGDRCTLYDHLCHLYPELTAALTVDPYLIFWGMQAIRDNQPFPISTNETIRIL